MMAQIVEKRRNNFLRTGGGLFTTIFYLVDIFYGHFGSFSQVKKLKWDGTARWPILAFSQSERSRVSKMGTAWDDYAYNYSVPTFFFSIRNSTINIPQNLKTDQKKSS